VKFVALAVLALFLAGCSRDPLVAPQNRSAWVQLSDPNGTSMTLRPDGTARLEDVTLRITCQGESIEFTGDFEGSWSTGVYSSSTIVSGFMVAEDLPDDLGPVSGKFVARSTTGGSFDGSAQALTYIYCSPEEPAVDEPTYFTLVPVTP
jgi:hypothetical protein